MKKFLKTLYNFVFSVEIIAVVLILILNFGPLLFNMRPYVVTSGSMEPAIHTGSLIYIDLDVKGEDVKEGDVIAFYISESASATHRVIEVNSDEKYFITQGDANEFPDFNPVTYDMLIGRTEHAIPYLGYVINWLSTLRGKIIFGCLFLAQYILQELFFGEETEQDEKE